MDSLSLAARQACGTPALHEVAWKTSRSVLPASRFQVHIPRVEKSILAVQVSEFSTTWIQNTGSNRNEILMCPNLMSPTCSISLDTHSCHLLIVFASWQQLVVRTDQSPTVLGAVQKITRQPLPWSSYSLNERREKEVSSPIHRWVKETERLSDSPKVTEYICGRAGNWTQVLQSPRLQAHPSKDRTTYSISLSIGQLVTHFPAMSQ